MADVPKRNRGLPAFATQYLESLKSEYEALDPNWIKDEAAKKLIDDRLKSDPPKGPLDWGDLFIIERAILKLQSDDKIRRRAWELRDEYRVVIGEDAYRAYVESKPPEIDPSQPSGADTKKLRSDLDQILSVFHWLYMFTPTREKARNLISLLITGGMLIALGVILWSMVYDFRHPNTSNVSSFLMILFMGALGAFVSLQHRIQQVQTSGDPIINLLMLKNGWVSVLLSPVSGAVFAFVLFLAFGGGVLQGSFFPEMVRKTPQGEERPAAQPPAKPAQNPPQVAAQPAAKEQASEENTTVNDEALSLHRFLWRTIPSKPVEYAKLLLWCFIIGFAERLVPDTLDRMIARKITVLTTQQPNTVQALAQPPTPTPTPPPPPA